jgi:hypothetical protein
MNEEAFSPEFFRLSRWEFDMTDSMRTKSSMTVFALLCVDGRWRSSLWQRDPAVLSFTDVAMETVGASASTPFFANTKHLTGGGARNGWEMGTQMRGTVVEPSRWRTVSRLRFVCFVTICVGRRPGSGPSFLPGGIIEQIRQMQGNRSAT